MDLFFQAITIQAKDRRDRIIPEPDSCIAVRRDTSGCTLVRLNLQYYAPYVRFSCSCLLLPFELDPYRVSISRRAFRVVKLFERLSLSFAVVFPLFPDSRLSSLLSHLHTCKPRNNITLHDSPYLMCRRALDGIMAMSDCP